MTRYIHALLRSGKCSACASGLFVWVGIILFSSTSLAGKASDAALTQFFVAHVRRYDTYDLYHLYHVHFLAEKSVHVAMFIVFAMLLWRVLPDVSGKARTVLLCGTLIGCCSELAQCLFPGRDPAFRDVALNVTGTVIGVAVSLSRNVFRRRSSVRKDISAANSSSIDCVSTYACRPPAESQQ
jgi:glycopeptide antibiotics resistance protein